MKLQIKAFLSTDEGAVTVDWVVLTALVTGLAMLAWTILEPVVFESASDGISGAIQQATAR